MKGNQKEEIQQIHRYLRHCKRRRWLLGTPFGKMQKLILGRHRILDAASYFPAILARVGKAPTHSLEEYQAELRANAELEGCYLAAVAAGQIPQKYSKYVDRFTKVANIVNYYALIRELSPQIVVETGTAAGSMTSWILAAMERNAQGHLISIDLPAKAGKLTMDTTVELAGLLIPQEYRHRWTYEKGDAKILLPKLLVDHAADIFIHDSLHTRTHMLYEYNVARALLRPGALILSDDILWNSAFFDFLASHKLSGLGCIDNPNLGFAVNEFDSYEMDIGTGVVRLET